MRLQCPSFVLGSVSDDLPDPSMGCAHFLVDPLEKSNDDRVHSQGIYQLHARLQSNPHIVACDFGADYLEQECYPLEWQGRDENGSVQAIGSSRERGTGAAHAPLRERASHRVGRL